MEGRELDELAAIVFIDIAVIVVVARLMGMLFRRLRQPAVVAEILAGLALGPSLLGAVPGDLTERLFPADVRPFLSVIAGLGLVIFMFIVGLELDLGLVRGKTRAAATISVTSVALPFGLGALLALWLHRSHGTAEGGEEVGLLPFALFIGAAMSVTAFPVLARILTERRMHRTETGVLTLACAAIDDVLAWTMLAVVLAVVNAGGLTDLLVMLAEAVAFILAMFWLVRPRLRLLVSRRDRAGRLTPDIFAVVLVGVLLSSYVTEHIGIHAIFGAFLFGAIMPREGGAQLSHEILERVEQVTVLLLLPVFFIATGLNVDVRGLGSTGAVELVAVLLVACVGKFVGAAAAARFTGVSARRSSAVGILMNTRGLTELVILNIGLAAGVLDRQLFTVMVLMAVITTIMTEPLLRLIYPDRAVARDIAQAEKAALGVDAGYRVVAVAQADAEAVVDTGVALLGGQENAQLVISRFEPPASTVEVGSGLTSELAAMAASLEAQQALADRASAQGAAVVVRSQSSEDVAADVLRQVETIEPDVVVVSAGDHELAGSVVDRAEPAVVVVRRNGADVPADVPLSATSGVAVAVGTGDDGLAALEHGLRVAARRGAPLSLLKGADRREQRRAGTLRRRLADSALAGVTVDESTPAPGDTVLVAGWSDWQRRPDTPAGTDGYAVVLLVRAAVDDHGERLAGLLSASAARTGSA